MARWAGRCLALPFVDMTAKEQLRHRNDPVVVAFRDAPVDDEPFTEEDEAALAEARADIVAGRTTSLDEAMRELE